MYYNLLQLYENLQCLGFLKIKMLSIIQAGLFLSAYSFGQNLKTLHYI